MSALTRSLAARWTTRVARTINSTTLSLPKRCASTTAIHPSIRHLATRLAQTQPPLTVPADRIRVLKHPAEFYALLLDMIRRAEHRIFISSLYIGSAESELIEALRNTLSKKPSVKLHLQLDLNRSTRPGASSTAKILMPLLQEFSGRVTVSMFRSPHLRGLLAKLVPPRFNEGWGTWHAKIYGVDDEVIISGANLNKSYFTNRQDRYIHFTDQPNLAQYCFDFLQTISRFSYRLSTTPGVGPHSFQGENYFLDWPDPHTHPHRIHQKAREGLSLFQSARRQSVQEDLISSNVLLFPIIQAGQFGIHEEETALSLLYRNLHTHAVSTTQKQPVVDLTTGYFGLYDAYQKLVLENNVNTRIVAASPKANGFFGSKGISGRIPEGYTLLEQRFMAAVKKVGRQWKNGTGVQLTEWERDGWTYHAKGIWVSPSTSSLPVLTLFGSTNLNSRSAHIDTKLSFIMIIPTAQDAPGTIEDENSTSQTSIQYQLRDEIDRLRANASVWKGGQRNVRFWTKLLVRLVKSML